MEGKANQHERWRIKREFSIGDLIAIIAASLGILASWWQMDKRVSLLETGIIAQNRIDTYQDSAKTALQRDIQEQLSEIKLNQRRTEDKLDRALERLSQPR